MPDPVTPADEDAPVLSHFGRYRKTVAAVIVGALGWGTSVVVSAPAEITASEWLMGGTVLATAVGVFAIANRP